MGVVLDAVGHVVVAQKLADAERIHIETIQTMETKARTVRPARPVRPMRWV